LIKKPQYRTNHSQADKPKNDAKRSGGLSYSTRLLKLECGSLAASRQVLNGDLRESRTGRASDFLLACCKIRRVIGQNALHDLLR